MEPSSPSCGFFLLFFSTHCEKFSDSRWTRQRPFLTFLSSQVCWMFSTRNTPNLCFCVPKFSSVFFLTTFNEKFPPGAHTSFSEVQEFYLETSLIDCLKFVLKSTAPMTRLISLILLQLCILNGRERLWRPELASVSTRKFAILYLPCDPKSLLAAAATILLASSPNFLTLLLI